MKEIELDENLEEIIVYAERYALGRRTYAVSSVINFIRPKITLLSTKTLMALHHDLDALCMQVERTGIDGLWGMECDKREWKRLWNSIKVELANRKGSADG